MITKIETKILQYIGTDVVSISFLTSNCGLSKPAIQKYINKFVTMGIVKKNVQGPKKILYSLVDKSTVENKLKLELTNTLDSVYSATVMSKEVKPVVVSAFTLYLTNEQKKLFSDIANYIEYSETEEKITPELFVHRYREAEIAIISFTFDFVTPELLKQCTKLKHVITLTKFSSQYGNSDDYKNLGITFWDLSEPDVNYIKHSSKEYIVLAVLSCIRPIHNAIIDVMTTQKTGVGIRDKYIGSELHGKMVGIVGITNSASHVIPILHSFGAQVKIYNPDNEKVDMYDLGRESYLSCQDLFETCDVVVYTDNYYKNTPKLEKMFSETMKTKYLLVLGEYEYTFDFFIECRKYIVSGKLKGLFLDYLSKSKDKINTSDVSDMVKQIMYLPNVYITPFLGPVSTVEAISRRAEYTYNIVKGITQK
jgi:phosphoglycerate dehydrogenase-like enzyme/predicted transcriptional regulator